jgi:hypothetical protein
MSDDAEKKEEEKGLANILKQYKDSPSPEQIEKWKATFGDVYVSGFSETELFVWRSITRPEWVELQSFAANPDNKVDNFGFEVLVCETCVLWSSVTVSLKKGKAGTPSALQEQILQNSNFLTPQAAAMLVAKL